MEYTMSKASLNMLFFVFGIALTAFAGSRLGHIVGVTWEIAAFAASIVISAVSLAGAQTGKRIDDLEKKVSELENARKVQA
jgi:membrane protein implicated in regulation of membrane protease activity